MAELSPVERNIMRKVSGLKRRLERSDVGNTFAVKCNKVHGTGRSGYYAGVETHNLGTFEDDLTELEKKTFRRAKLGRRGGAEQFIDCQLGIEKRSDGSFKGCFVIVGMNPSRTEADILMSSYEVNFELAGMKKGLFRTIGEFFFGDQNSEDGFTEDDIKNPIVNGILTDLVSLADEEINNL